MRILLTGVAGFLGSHLADLLVKMNYEVIGIDNFLTGSQANLVELSKSRNFQFKNPVGTAQTNFLGILNCLELAKKLGIPIFQSSTSEVYGDPQISPQPENYWGHVNPIGVRSCYDEGKRVAETLMFDYHRQFGTNIKIARIFNTYGPRMNLDDGRVVSNFIKQAIRNEPITIYGDGTQTRSFCFVTGPINLGNPVELNMIQLAERVILLTKSRSKIIKSRLPQDDPKQRKPDINLAKSTLSWEPTISIDQGLIMTIKDYQHRFGDV